MQNELESNYAPLVGSHIYGGYNDESPIGWSDWNSSNGGTGYWLIGAALALVITGSVMVTSSIKT
jgi:hypothetical protein